MGTPGNKRKHNEISDIKEEAPQTPVSKKARHSLNTILKGLEVGLDEARAENRQNKKYPRLRPDSAVFNHPLTLLTQSSGSDRSDSDSETEPKTDPNPNQEQSSTVTLKM